MRIPPYYKNPLWQRFFSGVALGTIISWVVFLYLYGNMQERQAQLIHAQREEIKDLNLKNEVWENEYKALNEQNEQKLTVQDISVHITNDKIYNLDPLSVTEAQEAIKDDLSSLIAKDIETVYKGKDLLQKSIENKIIEINKKRYRIIVSEIMFFTTLTIEVKIRQI
ncbi:sporulation membrane protein YtrI [Peribacillus tepidiphilus]|uniref:sporulation membrane protein YtrI n=1 Tax=Peribacillus tepidiphilus TaxID=2652445 RepID=UPI001290E7DE|nr:sporulation membrane protein YtrI [Peribacillus tepidiphilus]